MKRALGLVAATLLFAGCATNSSVRGQIEPLEKRIAALEQQQGTASSKLDSRLGEISKKQDAQASELQALRGQVGDSSAAGQKAQQAADDARAAAERAEAAAQKSEKAFELRQQKGRSGGARSR